jgi:PAS domain S-box-containing protein
MQDHEKTQDQLIEELRESRLRVAEFEAAEARAMGIVNALKDSEEHFFLGLLKHSPVMLLIEPMTGQILDANNAAERFYGYTMSQLRSMSIQDINILGPDEVAHERILALQEKQNHFIFPHRLANGEVRTVEVHSTPIERGEKTLLFSIIQDVTERKRVEEELRESREALELALNGARMGMWQLHVPTMTGKVDQRAAKILSFHETDISSNSYEWDKMTHPDDLPKLQESLSAHLEGRVPVFETEHRMRKSSGEWVWVHGRGTIMKRNEDGTPLLVYGTILDITYRKRAEDALRESEERFRLASQSITDVVWEWDLATGGLKWFGDIDGLLGYDPGEFPRTIEAWEELIDPEDNNRVMTALDRHIKEGYQYDEEYRVRRKDGGISYWQDRGTAIRDTGGKAVRMVGAVSDITERKRAEEALKDEKQRFQSLGENSPFGMVIIQPDGTFSYANRKFKEMFGYDLSDVPNGREWFRKAYPDNSYRRENISAWIMDTRELSSGETRPRVFTVTCKDLTEKTILFRPVKLDSGEDLMTCEDITEYKRVDEELRRYREHLEELVEERTTDLERANEELSLLLESLPVIVVSMNAAEDLPVTYMSQNVVDVTGYSAEDFTSNPHMWTERLHPEDLPKTYGVYAGLIKEGYYENEFLWQIADGSFANIYVRLRLIKSTAGTYDSVVGTIIDITHRKLLEQALRKSEHQWRTLIETMNEGVVLLDSNATITYANDKITEMLGYSREEMFGKLGLDFVNKVDREILYEKFTKRETLESISESYEVTLIGRNGRSVPVIASAKAILGENDQFQGSVITYVDISQYMQAMEALRESEEKYKALIETTDTGYLILDSLGKVTDANIEYLRLSGHMTLDQIIGRSVVEWTAEHHREQNDAEVTKCLQQGYVRGLEIDYVDKKGQITPVEINGTVVKIGQSFQIVALCRDITARKKVEEVLRGSEAQLRQIIDLVPHMIFVKDWDSNYLLVNRAVAEARNTTVIDLLGKSHAEVHPDYRELERMLQDDREVMTKGETKFIPEELYTDAYGKKRFLQTTKVPFHSLAQNKQAVLGVAIDITERKKAEEELKRAWNELEARVEERTTTLLKANEKLAMEIAERERAELELKESHQRLELALAVTSRLRVMAEAASAAKTEFLTIMSHELRTPLTAIIGFSELLYDQSFGKLNDKQSAYAREVFEAGHLLLQLINNILDLAKVESGKMDLQISSVDLGQLLQDCLIMIGESAAKRRHSLDLRISDDLEGVEILADEVKLKQILVNLLTNAVKFTPSAGRIYLECEVKGDNLLISVSDTGIGINPEDQKCIFDVFQQLDSTFSRQEQGTGLGLALVYRLVELHGGLVWVESEGNGKGSTFRFTIPFIQAKKGKEDEAHRLEGARIPFARPLQELPDQDEEQPRVLVVEDNEANMTFIADLLQVGGYAILQAVSAEEGIRIAESESPALILMDISLFDMDGLTAARILKANPATSDIPLIALTAHAMNEDEPRARQAGCDAYLTKPVNTMIFFRTVADLIKARKVKAFQKQDS